LQVDAGVMRAAKLPPSALLAAGGTQSVSQSAWARDALACADVGIDPGSAVFSQSVADLHHSQWAEENLYESSSNGRSCSKG
jgi:hypothetical protein